MKAVILAGGYGTRLRPLTYSKPKPLLPLLNKPILEYILDHLRDHGITEAIITTNYLREKIMDHFRGEYKGVKLSYPVESKPLGTAGCVKNIQDQLDETFLIIQGDTITDFNISELIRWHRHFGSLATIGSYRVCDPWNYGVLELSDSGCVKKFIEKPPVNDCTTDLVNTGVYVIEPEALDRIPRDTFYDFAKNLFPDLLESQRIYSHRLSGFWVDVGRPAGYNLAKKWLMDSLNNFISSDADITPEIDGPMNISANVRLESGVQITGPVFIGENTLIRRNTKLMPYTVIGSNVEVHRDTLLDGAVLFDENQVAQDAHITEAIIAENCRIGFSDTIQSDVLIGGGCRLDDNVSVHNGSRIWPGMEIGVNSHVNGTLKRFIQVNEYYRDPKWSLRSLTPDEAFYFNKQEGGSVLYTGLRAKSLLEFDKILREVDMRSLDYHMRAGTNDFQQWADEILCDPKLSKAFNTVKAEYKRSEKRLIRHVLIEITSSRLNELLQVVTPKGYA